MDTIYIHGNDNEMKAIHKTNNKRVTATMYTCIKYKRTCRIATKQTNTKYRF